MLKPLPLDKYEPKPITQFLNREWALIQHFPRPAFTVSAQWFVLADDADETILMAIHFPKSIYAPSFAPVEEL
jgi:hypothetical protein